jgi:hypothetical protein
MKSASSGIPRLAAALLAFGSLAGTAVAQVSQQGRQLTPTWRSAIVEGVSTHLVQGYFDRAVAEKIAAHVRERQKAGAYDALDDPAEFARLLTIHLREVNADLHLSVRYSPEPMPERRAPSQPTPAEITAQRDRAAAVNFGFTELKMLRARVGYVRFDAFHPVRWSKPMLDTALAFLRNTSALIVDLRYNTGGEADMVDALNEALLRRDPALTFVLTSGGTASAAEAVAHEMRQRNGATLIGDKTLGAGSAGTMRRVDAHFEVFVPILQAAWEAVGVAPHVQVAPEAAFERAQQIAAERLAERAKAQADRDGLGYLADSARLRAEAILLSIRPAAFDAADANAVSGRYRYPNSVLRIWIEDDGLMAQVEGRARTYRLAPRSDGTYFAANDRVVVRFLRNEAGEVVALDWFEGGRSSPAHRIR